jgi:CrcB protein
LLVSAGGVLGSLSRFFLLGFFDSERHATSAANFIGAALAAHLLVLMERRGKTELRWFLIPGLCGGLTTFSGVTYESILHPHENWVFLSTNVIFSFVAVAISMTLSRKWIKVKP